MPFYIDRHDPVPQIVTFTRAEFEEGHRRDLAVQEKYGARYITGLIDPISMTAYCIIDAPSKEAAEGRIEKRTGLWRIGLWRSIPMSSSPT